MQHSFFLVLGLAVGDDVGIVGDGDGGTGGVVGCGVNGGGGDDGCHEASVPATDRSPVPSSCGISAISGRTHVGSLGGSLGGWRCRLRFASGACGDGLVVAPAPLPAAPTAAFFAAVRIRLPAATAFVIAAAAVVAAAAAGALVAVEATTAA